MPARRNSNRPSLDIGQCRSSRSHRDCVSSERRLTRRRGDEVLGLQIIDEASHGVSQRRLRPSQRGQGACRAIVPVVVPLMLHPLDTPVIVVVESDQGIKWIILPAMLIHVLYGAAQTWISE